MALGDGIRRNVAHISVEERNRLRDAIVELNNRFYPDGVSKWVKQDKIHEVTHVHSGASFVTWHRELVNRFEKLLQEIDPEVSLHYWDWTQDPRAASDGQGGVVDLLTDEFMGAAAGAVGDPYAGFPPFARDVASSSARPDGTPAVASDSDIINSSNNLPQNQQWTAFRSSLQGNHNGIHGYVGGSIGAGHTAFEDPFVYLLHANVDRLWAMWQTVPGQEWRLDPGQVYGNETDNPRIVENLEPWDGGSGLRPWAPPENEQEIKNSKDPSVVTPPSYDTNLSTITPPLTLEEGVYTIQQKNNDRFVDAHQSSGNDFSLVTRTAQNNDTQRWILTRLGDDTYTIQQKSSDRFVDAHQSSGNDFSLVTRTAQNNDTQRWILTPLGDDTYTIQQKSSDRFVDAHESAGNDFSLVTRTAQNNDTQRWIFTPVVDTIDAIYTIQQKSNDRFVDAHQNAGNDFSLVTRIAQNNDTQRWIFTPVGGIYTVQQKSNGRFMDAHQNVGNDFSLVSRTAQNNDTQRWILTPLGDDTYTIQQKSNGRFVDAHQNAGNDFSLVTRTAQNNDTQRWILTPLGDDTYTIQQKSSDRFVDAHESAGRDFSLVTRTAQNNDTQRWILKPVGGIYTIQQNSNGRFVDAHQNAGNDFSLVTRTAQNNDTQRWILIQTSSLGQGVHVIGAPLEDDTYSIQQESNDRFVDAHQIAEKDFSLVTRTAQNNDTQRWVIKRIRQTIKLNFEGFFQCRLATDTAAFDDPRGTGGWTFAFGNEPDLDRVIRMQHPVALRSQAPNIGVKVTSVSSDSGIDASDLIGADIELLQNAVFEGRNGIISGGGEEPISPMNFQILGNSFRIERKSIYNPEIFSEREPFMGKGIITLPDVNVRGVSISDSQEAASYRASRLAALQAELLNATSTNDQQILQQRIDRLSVPGSGALIVTLFSAVSYRFPLRDDSVIEIPAGSVLEGRIDSTQPWELDFWMGCWDADTLTGYVRGVITISTI